MKIFITGGSGFIGKSLVEKLSDHDLLILSRSLEGQKVIRGDLNNIEEWRDELLSFNPDCVIHLAWEGIPDHGYKKSFWNIAYSYNLFNLLLKTNCKKVIVSGSCFEYGKKQGEITEEDSAVPTDPFTAAKTFIQQMGQDMFKDSETKFIWTRFFYVYGPNQREGSLIPTIYNSLSKDIIPDIRKPDARNDFIHISDVVDAVTSLINSDVESGTYNIGTGKTESIRKIIELIKSELSKNLEINAKGGENVNFHSNISKIMKATNWTPKTSIEDGVKDYINSRN